MIKQKMDELQAQIAALYWEIGNLRKSCKHEFAPLVPHRRGRDIGTYVEVRGPMDIIAAQERVEEFVSESAKCIHCGTEFGWRCPSSPDGVCHYASHCGEVRLIDGTQVPIPAGHNTEYETADSCIYCKEPEERL